MFTQKQKKAEQTTSELRMRQKKMNISERKYKIHCKVFIPTRKVNMKQKEECLKL